MIFQEPEEMSSQVNDLDDLLDYYNIATIQGDVQIIKNYQGRFKTLILVLFTASLVISVVSYCIK